jgi:hypothetical protein
MQTRMQITFKTRVGPGSESKGVAGWVMGLK